MRYEKNRKIFGIDEYEFFRYFKVLIVPVVIIILISIFLLADFLTSKKAKGNNKNILATQSSISENEEAVSGRITGEIPEINELISKYQNAILNADESALYSIFREETGQNSENLKEKMKLYQSYENNEIYLFRGMDENSYVAVMRFDIKFKDSETYAPSLSYAYVIKDEDGYYIKNPTALSTAQLARISEIENTNFIKDLEKDTSIRLSNALVGDARLATVYKILLGIEETQEYGQESESSTQESVEEAQIIVETVGETQKDNE